MDVWLEWDGGILMDGNEQKVGFAEKKLRLTQKMEGGFIFRCTPQKRAIISVFK